MAVDTTPTVDVRARLRQVPVQELVLPIVIIALIIVGVIIRPGVFLTSDNLLNVLTQASITGIIAIGMTFVIATGGIDLSVGSVLAAACIAGGLLAEYGSWMFMLGAIGFALLLGCINGLAITWGKVVPFIATLAMLTIARGLALWMSDKTPISLIELEILQGFGSGRGLGVPVPALVFGPCRHCRRGPAQPHPLRPPRDRRRRQPQRRPDRRHPPRTRHLRRL